MYENDENINDIYFIKPEDIKETKKEKKKPKITKKMYTGEEILNTLKDVNEFSQTIINKINDNYITEQDKNNVNHFVTQKKRKRTRIPIDENIEKSGIKETKNKEIQTNEVINNVTHTKEDADNIIKKVKCILFSNVINHINKYIKNEDNKLLYIDYYYINQLKKDFDSDLLKMELSDLVSLNISKKYKNYQLDWNKIIIQKIINTENEKLKNLLKLTFDEWIDIFTYKKKSEYNLDINLLQPTLEKIYDKNKGNDKNKDDDKNKDENYFTRFIFYLYNYQRWFHKKRGRKGGKRSKLSIKSKRLN